MYSTDVISALAERIGWAPPRPPAKYTLTGTNAGTTGRTFDSFHKLLTIENIEAVMPVSNALTAQETITNSSLNEYLAGIRTQAAMKVLNRLISSNPHAQFRINSVDERVDTSGYDRTGLLMGRLASLDDCLGYQVAYDCLELILTTSRVNYRERNGKETGSVRLEQQGALDENGNRAVDGVFAKLERAYKTASGILFPQNAKPAIRNASHLW